MIERKIVQQKIREFMVENYVSTTLNRVGHSKTKISRSPLGEKITIYASRPGLIVGSKGSNIKRLTKILKAKFKLENPQIEIEEIKVPNLDPKLVAEQIAGSLERFGTQRFKGVGYKSLDYTMKSGALGIEILISGKIPSSRAKRWRFYKGYLKKCGDISVEGVKSAYDIARLKTGVVGIQVRIMPADIELPDQMKVNIPVTQIGEVKNENEVVVDLTADAKTEAEDSDNLKNIKAKVKVETKETESKKEKVSKAKAVEKEVKAEPVKKAEEVKTETATATDTTKETTEDKK